MRRGLRIRRHYRRGALLAAVHRGTVARHQREDSLAGIGGWEHATERCGSAQEQRRGEDAEQSWEGGIVRNKIGDSTSAVVRPQHQRSRILCILDGQDLRRAFRSIDNLADWIKRVFYEYESEPLERAWQSQYKQYNQVLRKLGGNDLEVEHTRTKKVPARQLRIDGLTMSNEANTTCSNAKCCKESNVIIRFEIRGHPKELQ